MKFTELALENFRSYTDAKITFPEESKKPLLTFIGENGTGKTTVSLAMVWALYGEKAIRRYAEYRPMEEQVPRTDFDLINKDVVAKSPRPFMRVTLMFEHEGKRYTLRRRVSAKGANPDSNRDLKPDEVELLEQGKPTPEGYPEGIIEDILPFDASQFFFFDGEDVKRFSGASAKETETAIELVLGIPEIREARNDMTTVQKRMLARLMEEPNVTEIIKQLTHLLTHTKNEAKDLEYGLEAKRKDLKTTIDELTRAQVRRGELKEIADDSAQLKQVEADIEAVNRGISEVEDQEITLVSRLPYFLVVPQLRETLERFRKVSGTDELTKEIAVAEGRTVLLNELMLEPQCLCGRDLEDREKRHILLLKQGIEGQLKELREKASKKTIPPIEEIAQVLGRLESVDVDFKELERKASGLRLRLIELDDKKLRLQERIKGSNVDEAVKVQTYIEQLLVKKTKLEGETQVLQDNLDSTLYNKSKYEDVLQKERRKLGGLSAHAAHEQLAGRLARAYDWMIGELSRKKQELIVKYASEYFDRVSGNGNWKGIEVDDNYSIWLIHPNGERVPPSAGWSELVALSLIYGLNKAASYEAPVVMDFVLGRLDSTRQLTLVNNLSDFANQIMILTLDSEIATSAVRNRLDQLSAAVYNVSRDGKPPSSKLGVLAR